MKKTTYRYAVALYLKYLVIRQFLKLVIWAQDKAINIRPCIYEAMVKADVDAYIAKTNAKTDNPGTTMGDEFFAIALYLAWAAMTIFIILDQL